MYKLYLIFCRSLTAVEPWLLSPTAWQRVKGLESLGRHYISLQAFDGEDGSGSCGNVMLFAETLNYIV